jgi:ferredoxin
MSYYIIGKEAWDKRLEELILSNTIFATISNEFGQDFELLKPESISSIIYNKPKPATPLKNFFLPVKEDVTTTRGPEKPRIIIGIPNCDIEALNLLDDIYLDKDYIDIFFKERRDQTLLISSDCFSTLEHCHCLSYDVKPYATKTADLSIVQMNGSIIFRSINIKGEEFVKTISGAEPLNDEGIISSIDRRHEETEALLVKTNNDLPDYRTTGILVHSANLSIWKKYSADCVSCGACTTICPTCTCFLLIDKPGFMKIKQLDACQYPGFERVAGGEDVLYELAPRFRNRYMCKYFWKPIKFKPVACTGCGRCIEACIGQINKNQLFRELTK